MRLKPSIKNKRQQQNAVNLDIELVYSFFLKGKKGIFQCTLYLKASPNSIVILLNLNKTASADYQPKHRPYMSTRVVQLLKHSGHLKRVERGEDKERTRLEKGRKKRGVGRDPADLG